MARPLKKGLAYFPMDTDLVGDRKIQRLLLQYQSEGLAVFVTVLCEIYRSHGYYQPLYDEFYFDIGFSLHIPEKRVKEIILYSVKIRLFDAKSLKNSKILTSNGIQRRYLEVCKRNKNQIDTTYLTVNNRGVSTAKTLVSPTETPVNSVITPVSSAETPTKGKGKREEIKEKKKEEKYTTKKNNYETNQFEKQESGDTARHRELCRMAAAATRGNQQDA